MDSWRQFAKYFTLVPIKKRSIPIGSAQMLEVLGPIRAGKVYISNRPRSIYQYSNMAPRLSGQNSIFGVVFFVSKSLLGIERQKKLEKFAILTRKPRSHVRILIYRTWPITYSARTAIVILIWLCSLCFLVKLRRSEFSIILATVQNYL